MVVVAAFVSIVVVVVFFLSSLLVIMTKATTALPRPSLRAQSLEPPHIENVLERYADIPDTANLALGFSHWSPPPNALQAIQDLMKEE